MPKVKTERVSTNYRLSTEGHQTIARVARRLGVSHTAVIEAAVRQLDRITAKVPPLTAQDLNELRRSPNGAG